MGEFLVLRGLCVLEICGIIRNKTDHEQIAKYIYENPMRWLYDEFYIED